MLDETASPRRGVLIASILGSSMAFADAGIVNVALPRIGRDLDLGLAGRQWVFLSYSLALASLYLVAGAAGDRRGQREVFAVAAGGFAAASLLAAAAPSGALLIGARTLQGVAGAFLTTSSLAYLRATFGDESGRAVGLWTAWTGITSMLGPPLGGLCVQLASWRLAFLLNLPVAAAAVALALRAPGRREAGPPRPFDLDAAALVAVTLAALTYALVEKAWWPWPAAAAGAVAFALRERRAAEPMLPRALLRTRNFVAANAVTLLVYAGLSGASFFLALYLQSVLAYSPVEAALVTAPVSLVMLALSGRFGRLADERGPRLYLAVGPLVTAAGMLVWAAAERPSQWWIVVAGVLVFAVGLSITVAPITATALKAAPAELAGVAAGVNNTVSRVGGLLAVAGIGLVVALVFRSSGGGAGAHALEPGTAGAARDASIAAFRAGMLAAATVTALGGLVAAVLVEDR